MKDSKQKTEVKLTEKQLTIIDAILKEKSNIQSAYANILEKESIFIVSICEALNIPINQGITFEGKSMFVPVIESNIEDPEK